MLWTKFTQETYSAEIKYRQALIFLGLFLQWGIVMDQNIERFKKGAKYVNIASAVTRDHLTSCEQHISDDYSNLKCVKLIPASGAATRMFEDLYKYVEDKIDTEFINTFFDELVVCQHFFEQK